MESNLWYHLLCKEPATRMVEIERLLAAKHQVQTVQHFITCRPWLPWCIPLGFALVVHFLDCILHTLAKLHSPIPCSQLSYVLLSAGMAALTIPLYRFPYIHRFALQGILVCIFLGTHHLSVCLYHSCHPLLSLPFGLLNMGLQIWILKTSVHGPKLRSWLWMVITQHLPMLMLPQILLLLIHSLHKESF